MNPNEPKPTHVKLPISVWQTLDALLADLPYRLAAPVVHQIQQAGGVVPLVEPTEPTGEPEPAPGE